MADFLLNALLAGLALALVAGPLGSFVVWRRMAYFGDTLSHAALLGVALGLMLDVSPTLAVTVGCVLLAVLLVTLQQRQPLASDTLLGILAHSTLSLGLVALSFMSEVRVDLMGYLFGDLLAVSRTDLAWILGGSALVLLVLIPMWRPLLAITVHEELARVEGLPVAAIRLALMLLIAVVIAVIAAKPLIGQSDQAFQFIQEFSGFFTPGITVIFLLGLFWKPATEAGAIVAAITSVVLSLILKQSIPSDLLPDALNAYLLPFMNRMMFVFVVSLFLAMVVSLVVRSRGDANRVSMEGVSFTTPSVFNVAGIGVILILIALYGTWW